MAPYKVKADTVIALLLVAAGVIFWINIAEAPHQARYYPRFIIGLAAVPTIILLIRSLVSRNKEKYTDLTVRMNTKVFICIVSVISYIALIGIIGYYVTTMVFIAGIMLFLGARKAITIAGSAFCMTLFIYLMFSRLLLISLPKGIFF